MKVIQIVEAAESPEGFVSRTKRPYVSLKGAMAGVIAALEEGIESVYIVHTQETGLFGESWHVGIVHS